MKKIQNMLDIKKNRDESIKNSAMPMAIYFWHSEAFDAAYTTKRENKNKKILKDLKKLS